MFTKQISREVFMSWSICSHQQTVFKYGGSLTKIVNQ